MGDLKKNLNSVLENRKVRSSKTNKQTQNNICKEVSLWQLR